jgi:3-hydroxybutyryl-CoA dehydrogenase
VANEQQQRELAKLDIIENDTFIFKNYLPQNSESTNFDGFFILSDFSPSQDFSFFENKPVFINEVIYTLSELNLPKNFSRINAWRGFLQRESWEIASNEPEKAQQVLKELKPKIIFVKDEPGLVAARVISMIVNEAFYALGENISTKEEIDLAMKLGTNYPQGPFEWAEKIGIEKIYSLLKKLSEKEERYIPAPALEKFILEK